MSTDTRIGWTDHTWNPWQGCRKVSAACKNCYMFRDKRRYGQDPNKIHRSARGTFRAPLAKNRAGEYKWAPDSRVFTCSWSDWWIGEADMWRDDAFKVIEQRPDLTFQILTKRPERIKRYSMPDNVWLGVTIENQEQADKRLPHLLRVDARVRFVSIEPMLGPIDLLYSAFNGADSFSSMKGIDWVIVGGESGPGARPSNPAWIRSIRDQCRTAGVPLMFKQWGEWGEWGTRIGNNRAGNHLDGVQHLCFPEPVSAL